jgi:hypothetical protein
MGSKGSQVFAAMLAGRVLQEEGREGVRYILPTKIAIASSAARPEVRRVYYTLVRGWMTVQVPAKVLK